MITRECISFMSDKQFQPKKYSSPLSVFTLFIKNFNLYMRWYGVWVMTGMKDGFKMGYFN